MGKDDREIVLFAATVLLVMAVLLLGPLHLGEGEAARLAAVLTFLGVLVTASVSLIGFMVNRQTEHRHADRASRTGPPAQAGLGDARGAADRPH